jgi:shikimate kinase
VPAVPFPLPESPRVRGYNRHVGLHRDNLFLVGMMGAGKTTLGRQLARRLGKRFVDADHELEARLGVPIPTIFEIEGEQAFRDREEAIVAELVVMTGIVLSTGGGVVGRAASRACLRANGTVLYLHAMPDTLWLRVRHARHRPMLHAPNPRARLAELYRQRDPLYREVAHHVVESERDAVLRLVRRLEAAQDACVDMPVAADASDSLAAAGVRTAETLASANDADTGER